MPEPIPTKLATDKIVAYLPKLNEFELSKISREISRLRKARKNKTQLFFDTPPNGEKENTSAH